MNKNYKDFADTAIKEVNTPLFAKIGMQDKIIKGFVLFLSVLNILAGFNFFYSPLKDISDNGLVAFFLSFIMLIIIESISLIAFQEAIFSINRKKVYGYLLMLLAIIILAFNVYSTAEGNKNFISKLSTKPKEMKTNLSDTINFLDLNFQKKSEAINRRFDSLNTSINQDYTLKIENCETDIMQSVNENGKVIDWRKNHEATKNKSLFLQNWEVKKQQLADAQNYEFRQLKQYTDSIKATIYNEQTTEISEIVETSDNSAKIAYTIGIILVFLIVTIRLIRVLALIGCSNWTKQTSGEVKVITQVHTVDLQVLELFEQKKEQNKDDPKKDNDYKIIDNQEVLSPEKKLKHSTNGNGNGHKNSELNY